jgi:hypothetical protein
MVVSRLEIEGATFRITSKARRTWSSGKNISQKTLEDAKAK